MLLDDCIRRSAAPPLESKIGYYTLSTAQHLQATMGSLKAPVCVTMNTLLENAVAIWSLASTDYNGRLNTDALFDLLSSSYPSC